jgi:uncharacterized protein (UPF0297 family)
MAADVTHMGDRRNACRDLVRKSERKGIFEELVVN